MMAPPSPRSFVVDGFLALCVGERPAAWHRHQRARVAAAGAVGVRLPPPPSLSIYIYWLFLARKRRSFFNIDVQTSPVTCSIGNIICLTSRATLRSSQQIPTARFAR